MSNYLTPKATVIDMTLRADSQPGVVDAVRSLREEGATFRDIAIHLDDVSGQRVTHETIRAWCLEWGIDVADLAPAGDAA